VRAKRFWNNGHQIHSMSKHLQREPTSVMLELWAKISDSNPSATLALNSSTGKPTSIRNYSYNSNAYYYFYICVKYTSCQRKCLKHRKWKMHTSKNFNYDCSCLVSRRLLPITPSVTNINHVTTTC